MRKYSSAMNECPNSDISSLMNLRDYFIPTNVLRGHLGLPNLNCSDILGSDQCTAKFGIELGKGTVFLDPDNLQGQEGRIIPMSDSDKDHVVKFPGPQTTTLTLLGGYTSAVTMVPTPTTASQETAQTATAARDSAPLETATQAAMYGPAESSLPIVERRMSAGSANESGGMAVAVVAALAWLLGDLVIVT